MSNTRQVLQQLGLSVSDVLKSVILACQHHNIEFEKIPDEYKVLMFDLVVVGARLRQ